VTDVGFGEIVLKRESDDELEGKGSPSAIGYLRGEICIIDFASIMNNHRFSTTQNDVLRYFNTETSDAGYEDVRRAQAVHRFLAHHIPGRHAMLPCVRSSERHLQLTRVETFIDVGKLGR
jgi:hypothetical protein